MKIKSTLFIAYTALIAAAYCVLTLALPVLSFGTVQLRFSEALTVLPAVIPGSFLGLTAGCFLSNLFGLMLGANPLGMLDCFFGTLATLLAGLLTSYVSRHTHGIVRTLLVPAPPVLFNALIIGGEFVFISQAGGCAALLIFFYIGLGEAAACYLAGVPLLHFLDKNRDKLLR